MITREVPPPGEGFGAYLRKSKVVEEGTDTLSIETQHSLWLKWCARAGVQPNPEHVYRDNASAWHGAAKDRRDAFRQALAAMERGEIRGLWCPNVSRLSRGGAGVVMSLIDQGKRFYFDREGLDSAVPQHRMLIAMFAEMERGKSDDLSLTIRENKARQREVGAWPGRAPYGTIAVGRGKARRLKRDPDTWPTVERIYREAAEGRGWREIARGLTADGIPAPGAGRLRKGKPQPVDWLHLTVWIIVHNPVYEGWVSIRTTSNKRIRYLNDAGQPVWCWAEGEQPIPAELAERARAPRNPAQPPDKRGKGRAVHMLTGRVFCAGCGSRMPVNGRYHTCGRKLRGITCPDPVRVKREPLEQAVWDKVLSRLINAKDGDPLIAVLSERWEARERPRETLEIKEAREAVQRAERRIQQIMDDRAAGLYVGPAANQFQRHHAAAVQAWEDAKARLAELTSTPVDHSSAVLAAFFAEGQDRREMLHLAVDRITVEYNGKFRIMWAGEGDPS